MPRRSLSPARRGRGAHVRRAVIALAVLIPGAARADSPTLVMPSIAPGTALTGDALWIRGTGPAVDGIVGELGYRLRLGERGWIEGTLGVQWAPVAPRTGVSLTDAELGAGYRLTAHAAVRARVLVPSAADGGRAGAVAGAIAALRVDDRARSLPGGTSAGGYGAWRSDGAGAAKFAAAVDAGLELWDADQLTPVLRVGVGGNVRVAPRVRLAAELTTLSFILDDGAAEDFVHALDLGGVVAIPGGALAVRLEVPLDASARARDAFEVGLRYTWAR